MGLFSPPVPPVPLSVWSTEYVILQSGSTTEYYSHQSLPILQHDADYYYGVLLPRRAAVCSNQDERKEGEGEGGGGSLRRGKARKGTSCKRDDDDDDYSVLLTLTHGTTNKEPLGVSQTLKHERMG